MARGDTIDGVSRLGCSRAARWHCVLCLCPATPRFFRCSCAHAVLCSAVLCGLTSFALSVCSVMTVTSSSRLSLSFLSSSLISSLSASSSFFFFAAAAAASESLFFSSAGAGSSFGVSAAGAEEEEDDGLLGAGGMAAAGQAAGLGSEHAAILERGESGQTLAICGPTMNN